MGSLTFAPSLMLIVVPKSALNAITKPFPSPPLCLAILGGHLPIVARLLDLPEVEINVQDGHRTIAPFLAVDSPNSVEMIEFLLDHPKFRKVWPDGCADSLGTSLLGQACVRGNTGVAKLLLDRGADVRKAQASLLDGGDPDDAIDWTEETGLHLAAQSGKLDCVKLMIHAGLTPDVIDTNGRTPIFTAIRYGHLAIVQYLVEFENVDLNMIDAFDMNPRDYADSIGMPHIALYLARKGAKSNYAALRHPRGVVAQWNRVWMHGHLPTPRNQPHVSRIGNYVYISGGWDGTDEIAPKIDPTECFRFCIDDIRTTTLRKVVPPKERPNAFSKTQVAPHLAISDNWADYCARFASLSAPSPSDSSLPSHATRSCRIRNNSPKEFEIRAFSALFDTPYAPSDTVSVGYFEVKILALGNAGVVAAGLVPRTFLFDSNLPGWTPSSFAYHSDDGTIFTHMEPVQWGPTGQIGDVIGVGVHWHQKCVFFTHNGQFLGCVPIAKFPKNALWGCIGLIGEGTEVEVNFGVDWFDLNDTVKDISDGTNSLTIEDQHAASSASSATEMPTSTSASSASVHSISRASWLFNFEVQAVRVERFAPHIEEVKGLPIERQLTVLYEFSRLNVTIGPYIASVSVFHPWIQFFDTRTNSLYKMECATINPFNGEPEPGQISFGEDKIFFIDVLPAMPFEFQSPGYELIPPIRGIRLRMINLLSRKWSEARIDLRHFKNRPVIDMATPHIPYGDGKLWFLSSPNSPFYIDVKKMRAYLMPSVRNENEGSSSLMSSSTTAALYSKPPEARNLWNGGAAYAMIPGDAQMSRDLNEFETRKNSPVSHVSINDMMNKWPAYNDSDINAIVASVQELLVPWNGHCDVRDQFDAPQAPHLGPVEIINTPKTNALTYQFEQDEIDEKMRLDAENEDGNEKFSHSGENTPRSSLDSRSALSSTSRSSSSMNLDEYDEDQLQQWAVFGGSLKVSDAAAKRNQANSSAAYFSAEGFGGSQLVLASDVVIFGPKKKKWTIPRVLGYSPTPKGQSGMTYIGGGRIINYGGNTIQGAVLPAELEILTLSPAFSKDDPLAKFFDNPQFSDFDIHLETQLGGTEVIKTHKALLVGRSEFFRLLLATESSRAHLPKMNDKFPQLAHLALKLPNRFDLQLKSAKHFRLILRYLYSDTVPSELRPDDYCEFMDTVELFFPEHMPRLGELLFLNRLSKNSTSIYKNIGFLLAESSGLELCDAKVIVEGEEEAIHVHRAILCARSDYFKALFSGSMTEGKSGVAMVSGIPHRVCKEIIRYLYTQNLEITDDMADFVVDFLVWSNAWSIPDLFASLESLVISNLTHDNVEYLSIIATEHLCPRLKEECEKFAASGGAAFLTADDLGQKDGEDADLYAPIKRSKNRENGGLDANAEDADPRHRFVEGGLAGGAPSNASGGDLDGISSANEVPKKAIEETGDTPKEHFMSSINFVAAANGEYDAKPEDTEGLSRAKTAMRNIVAEFVIAALEQPGAPPPVLEDGTALLETGPDWLRIHPPFAAKMQTMFSMHEPEDVDELDDVDDNADMLDGDEDLESLLRRRAEEEDDAEMLEF